MFSKKTKAFICTVIAFGLACGVISSETVQASGKAKLKTTNISMKVGRKKKIVIKKQNKKAVYRFVSSSKSKASVSKKGVITAKKKGKAVITVTEKLGKKSRRLGRVSVVITGKNDKTKQTPAPTQAVVTPTPTQPSSTPQPDVTAKPDNTQKPDDTQKPDETNQPSANMEPIAQYLEDTNYDAPAGFDRVDAAVAGVVEDITYDSTVIKEGEVVQRKAKVVLPKDYSENKKYPVVYLNHGIGGNEGSLAGDNVQNVIWNAIAEGVAEEMIAVFPSGCANEYNGNTHNGKEVYPFFSTDHYAGYNNFLNDLKECLMPYINEHYSTKTGREYTAIGGFSMGGRVTLHIGFSLQDDFRYIGAFCPAPGIFTHNDNGVNENGLFTHETFTLQDKYMDDTLVMIVKGGNDGIVKNFPKDYTDALTANNVPHIFYEVPGGGHDGGVYKPGMYNFFRRIFHEKE